MTRPAAVFIFLAAAAGAGIVAAIEEINSDYVKHSRGASEIAREEFEADKVLRKLLRQAGVSLPADSISTVEPALADPCLIVNPDDFGVTAGVNRGITEAHDVTSASLLVRYPAAAEAAEYGRRHLELSVGLHVE